MSNPSLMRSFWIDILLSHSVRGSVGQLLWETVSLKHFRNERRIRLTWILLDVRDILRCVMSKEKARVVAMCVVTQVP